jgi:hypothetical protein
MGFSWTSAPDEAHGPSAPGASGRTRVALMAAALAAVAALIVVGIATGTAALVLVAAIAALALWPALQGVERRWSDDWSAAAAQVRWLTPRQRPVDAALAGCPPVEGEARLLFVEMDARTIVVDGVLAPDAAAPGGVANPFWIRFRRPDTGWLSASLMSVARRWIDEGRAVRIVTRRTEAGMEAVLTASGSRMAVELEEVGGVERPAA